MAEITTFPIQTVNAKTTFDAWVGPGLAEATANATATVEDLATQVTADRNHVDTQRNAVDTMVTNVSAEIDQNTTNMNAKLSEMDTKVFNGKAEIDTKVANAQTTLNTTISDAETTLNTTISNAETSFDTQINSFATVATTGSYSDLSGTPTADWVYISTNTTLSPNTAYGVDFSASRLLTLPLNPTQNDTVFIYVSVGSPEGSTIIRNGQTIMGVNENMVIDYNITSIELVYNGTDWRIV